MDFQLENKNALILASSQGLGKAIAAELVKEGSNVMLVGRYEEKLVNAQEELQKLGLGKVVYTVTDLSKLEDIQALVKKTVDEFGSIDILINNAGGPPAGTFVDMSDEHWQQSFELNLLSYIRTIRESLPYLKQKGGRIVNIASSSIKEPIQGLILSNTFRTAIVGLAKTLSVELGPDNILINTVGPGRIATERIQYLDEVTAEKKGITQEQLSQQLLKNIPLGRYGEPEEFAKFVTFLVSGANTYLTGQSYLVDGGMVKSI
ncbi:SDR family oxidoreductase [Peribacillus asahii]|uniref:3-oxoacyl-ACP reductase n=1 Tax=Peribacillus asahii TaxID=228899 RepID=A0A3Q9RLT6_9BACI|nr:SDR family oxidoreductase [Peribacillus asahii]AZV42072.1 3-oxoacyl-ACP reductase [Peribacillus asahii]USK86396.1 SDR family oxidoreductase [Peribacillus asahii]